MGFERNFSIPGKFDSKNERGKRGGGGREEQAVTGERDGDGVGR